MHVTQFMAVKPDNRLFNISVIGFLEVCNQSINWTNFLVKMYSINQKQLIIMNYFMYARSAIEEFFSIMIKLGAT